MEIIAVCGKICSGKTTFADNMIFHTRVDIGSIVRDIMKKEERVHNEKLDEKIIERLRQMFKERSEEDFAIVGIRQISILDALFKEAEKVEVVWLEVPDVELKRRYINRDDAKDILPFEEALERDKKLGLGELEVHVKKLAYTKIVQNY